MGGNSSKNEDTQKPPDRRTSTRSTPSGTTQANRENPSVPETTFRTRPIPSTTPTIRQNLVKCPVRNLVYCYWDGYPTSTLSHCRLSHEDKILKGNKFTLTPSSFEFKGFLIHQEILFIVSVGYNFFTENFTYSICHIEDSTNSDNYAYKIILNKNNKALTVAGVTHAYGKGEESVSLNCLNVYSDCSSSITGTIILASVAANWRNSLVKSITKPLVLKPEATRNNILEKLNTKTNSSSEIRNVELFQRNLRDFRFDRVEESEESSEEEDDVNDYPHVYDQLRNVSVTTTFNGITFKQPENTVKEDTLTHVEFTIPGGERSHTDDIDLVKVGSLDPTGRSIFKDIKEFNRIQSEVFPVAYETNENMLICAPTGAGKTNIALLAIAHQIRTHMEGKFIRKDDFKIVYVCPMKALATEMVSNFSKKLSSIGIVVRELTGEMQLTKREIAETQMLVTTPEKWDVITRKGAVDSKMTGLVKLLILDEVHLLNSDRGPVIEALVARTLRQSTTRIVALSATLPGYLDVAKFLKVKPREGLFFFDNRFRSVPLTMTFIGVKTNAKKRESPEVMDRICYEKIVPIVQKGKQVMVFVTARNMTSTVAKMLMSRAQSDKIDKIFESNHQFEPGTFKSGDLEQLAPHGFGIHHAGMCRADRLAVEKLFKEGKLKVIVCTTTLAWGVNLPAYAVIIRGTSRYDAQKNAHVDMDMLDIMQIFGRAGRPQFDTSGHGMIITSVPYMATCISLITSQEPIESQFLKFLPDHLNAEVVLGTVTDLKQALEWLCTTFVYFRIGKKPSAYGVSPSETYELNWVKQHLARKLKEATDVLKKAQMITFNRTLNELRPLCYGRIASFFYVTHGTMKYFLDHFEADMEEADIFNLIAHASEFKDMKVRKDEITELERLRDEYAKFATDLDPKNASVVAKVLILIQANVSRAKIFVSSLGSDCEFIMQSVHRLARALFEIALEKKYRLQVHQCLQVAQTVEQQSWPEDHPFLQLKEARRYKKDLERLEDFPVDQLAVMSDQNFQKEHVNKNLINKIRYFCKIFPRVTVDVRIRPITEDVVRIRVLVDPIFTWDNKVHGEIQYFCVWLENPDTEDVSNFESFVISKKMIESKKPVELNFTLSSIDPDFTEYSVVVLNSNYMHTKIRHKIHLDKLHLLRDCAVETDLLDLRPLPITVLRHEEYQGLFPFTHFNVLQSQVFHCCYTSDVNVLLGAPTGSGKTVVAEICILRLFANSPGRKVVYMSPMRALIRKRVQEWSQRFASISKKVVEVSNDATHKSFFISSADIIILSPEKFDSISRNWPRKDLAKQIGLVIIDGIHLLAEDKGPEVEVIVSRINHVNSVENDKIRVLGLSTVMGNAGDLANWLGIEKKGLFNFGDSVRPVPLEIILKSFPTKNYPIRMNTMNKPAYDAVCQHTSGDSTALIFVSSRKQTQMTSYDLIKCLQNDSQNWLRCPEEELEQIRKTISDEDLKHALLYGIGIHHFGLRYRDRKAVEELFLSQKIRVLVATSNFAWSTDFCAHLVIVKGTEQYDGTTRRYVDMPISDVLQMVERAGRLDQDRNGVACVFIQEGKEEFYGKFLMEPFPVESHLSKVLPEHINAEIASGTVTCKSDLLDSIWSTFFFRRLIVNPAYYKMESTENVSTYLQELCDFVISKLAMSKCITIRNEKEENYYESTFLGQIAAQYYLSCKTVLYLHENLSKDSSVDDLILHLSQVEEYALISVRQDDDQINKDLIANLNVKTKLTLDSLHLKVLLLLKCYLVGMKLPNEEYEMDLRTVFGPVFRIVHAMINLTAYKSWLGTTQKLIYLCQMLVQGLMLDGGSMMMLPYMTEETSYNLLRKLIANRLVLSNCHFLNIPLLKIIMKNSKKAVNDVIENSFDQKTSGEIMKVLNRLPILEVDFVIRDVSTDTVVEYKTDRNDKTVYFEIKAETCCIFEFNLLREGASNVNVYSKKCPKPKEETWFCLMAIEDELLRMQKFVVTRNKTFEVQMKFPSEQGTYKCSCRFLCDSYIGLDQKIVFTVKVID